MRVTVIANRVDPEPGYVGERLAELGATLIRQWREDLTGSDLLDPRADLVVLLGSDWSVYDSKWSREVAAEQFIVHEAHRRGTPILAICFGAQLVASALGSVVSRADRPEIGWMTIESDNSDLCPSGPWLQFHHDRWTNVSGANVFAYSDVGPQAFTYQRTLAVQFHPEVESEVIDRWLDEASPELQAADVDPQAVRAESVVNEQAARQRCYTLVDSFLDDVATRPLS